MANTQERREVVFEALNFFLQDERTLVTDTFNLGKIPLFVSSEYMRVVKKGHCHSRRTSHRCSVLHERDNPDRFVAGRFVFSRWITRAQYSSPWSSQMPVPATGTRSSAARASTKSRSRCVD